MKAVCLIVVKGGVAEVYAPAHVQCEVIDLDNIEAGDGPVSLPPNIGFEALVDQAGLDPISDYTFA